MLCRNIHSAQCSADIAEIVEFQRLKMFVVCRGGINDVSVSIKINLQLCFPCIFVFMFWWRWWCEWCNCIDERSRMAFNSIFSAEEMKCNRKTICLLLDEMKYTYFVRRMDVDVVIGNRRSFVIICERQLDDDDGLWMKTTIIWWFSDLNFWYFLSLVLETDDLSSKIQLVFFFVCRGRRHWIELITALFSFRFGTVNLANPLNSSWNVSHTRAPSSRKPYSLLWECDSTATALVIY